MRAQNRTGAVVAGFFFALLVGGCAASGQSSPASAGIVAEESSADTDEALSEDPDVKSCRNYRETGTRVTQRICKYNHEWQAEAEQSRKALREVQRDANIGVSSE